MYHFWTSEAKEQENTFFFSLERLEARLSVKLLALAEEVYKYVINVLMQSL